MLSRLNVFRLGLFAVMALSAWFTGWVGSNLGVSEAGPLVVTLLAALASSLFFVPAVFLFVSSFVTFAADPSSGALIIPQNSGYYRLMKWFHGKDWHREVSGCVIFWNTVWLGAGSLVAVFFALLVVAMIGYMIWGFTASVIDLSRGMPFSDLPGGQRKPFVVMSIILVVAALAVVIVTIIATLSKSRFLAAFFRALTEHSCPRVLFK